MTSRSVRFFFSSLDDAAEALMVTLQDMRDTDHTYSISGLTAQSVLQSGLTLTGEIDDVVSKVKAVPSAVAYE